METVGLQRDTQGKAGVIYNLRLGFTVIKRQSEALSTLAEEYDELSPDERKITYETAMDEIGQALQRTRQALDVLQRQQDCWEEILRMTLAERKGATILPSAWPALSAFSKRIYTNT